MLDCPLPAQSCSPITHLAPAGGAAISSTQLLCPACSELANEGRGASWENGGRGLRASPLPSICPPRSPPSEMSHEFGIAEAQGRRGSAATAVGKRRGGRQAARDIPNLWLPLGAEGGLSDVGGQGPNPCRGKALSSGLLPALEGLTPAEPVWGKAAGLQGKRELLGPATRFLPFTWCPLHS